MRGDSINRESEGLSDAYFEGMYDEEDDELCGECGGDGWVAADCFEDACCCLDPETQHGMEPCPNCNPRGDQ
jgi:hypothetical protein